jgi:hypothetical protein
LASNAGHYNGNIAGTDRDTNMRTRQTSDYSPTLNGSREQNQAIAARREMLGWMAAQPVNIKGQRKNHDKRVENNFNVLMNKIRKEEEARKAAKAP